MVRGVQPPAYQAVQGLTEPVCWKRVLSSSTSTSTSILVLVLAVVLVLVLHSRGTRSFMLLSRLKRCDVGHSFSFRSNTTLGLYLSYTTCCYKAVQHVTLKSCSTSHLLLWWTSRIYKTFAAVVEKKDKELQELELEELELSTCNTCRRRWGD